jgi:hypothetical protein
VRNDSSANADSLPNATSSPELHPEADIQAALDFLKLPIEKFEKCHKPQLISQTQICEVLICDPQSWTSRTSAVRTSNVPTSTPRT